MVTKPKNAHICVKVSYTI